MLTLDAARQLLAKRVRPLPDVRVALCDALGCRLAEEPRADIDLPAADVSVMDGYAACAGDLTSGAFLRVAFTVPAGHSPPSLPRGSVARIFTGAVIPNGANAVVPQEQADVRDDGAVRLPRVEPGTFIRRKAEICAAAATLASGGETITPQLIGLLGAAGVATVRVISPPRVAVLSTGSELVPIHEHPAPGKIRDSNGAMLAALVQRARFTVRIVERVADDIGAMHDAIARAALEVNLIVTCGGVSVGDYDLVPKALNDMGAETLFHRISIKPGKPLLAARLGDVWFVGLPGNPLSALVGWRLFARPLAQALSGVADAFAESPTPGVLTQPVANRGDRTLLSPARLDREHSTPRVTVLPWKGSHDVVAMARANALARVEVAAAHAAGDIIPCYPLD